MPFDPVPLVAAIARAAARRASTLPMLEAALATISALYPNLSSDNWTFAAQQGAGAAPVDGVAAISAPPIPPAYRVIATDASAIRPDRHFGVDCALITVGRVYLSYGPESEATLDTMARHYGPGPATLARRLPGLCARAERRELGRLATQHLPDLALVDGPLVPRPLHTGRTLIPAALSSLETPVVGYISRPSTAAVFRSLRAVCCPRVAASGSLCSAAAPCKDNLCGTLVGVPDAVLFGRLLPEGFRSPVFTLPTPPHGWVRGPAAAGVGFFYLRTETDVARVDVPLPLAENAEALDQVHGILLRQCVLGNGYPRALSLAHQFAVLTSADRATYFALLARHGLALTPSPKALSKAQMGGRI